jgi:hypothetical protein
VVILHGLPVTGLSVIRYGSPSSGLVAVLKAPAQSLTRRAGTAGRGRCHPLPGQVGVDAGSREPEPAPDLDSPSSP